MRKALELTEVYIESNKWNAIPYNKVASINKKIYMGKFVKHVDERFRKYLSNVKNGKSNISAGAMLPYEIVAFLDCYGGCKNENNISKLRWKRTIALLFAMS